MRGNGSFRPRGRGRGSSMSRGRGGTRGRGSSRGRRAHSNDPNAAKRPRLDIDGIIMFIGNVKKILCLDNKENCTFIQQQFSFGSWGKVKFCKVLVDSLEDFNKAENQLITLGEDDTKKILGIVYVNQDMPIDEFKDIVNTTRTLLKPMSEVFVLPIVTGETYMSKDKAVKDALAKQRSVVAEEYYKRLDAKVLDIMIKPRDSDFTAFDKPELLLNRIISFVKASILYDLGQIQKEKKEETDKEPKEEEAKAEAGVIEEF